jgi:phage terminase small subunit
MPGLNARQAAFVDEYLVDLNATQAAIRAGYSKSGARNTGAELLTHRGIADKLSVELRKRKLATQLSVDATVDEIRALSHSDVRAIFDRNGRVLPPHEWPDEIARCVASFEVVERFEPGATRDDEPTRIEITKVKLWSKDGALTLKGKMQKLFTDVVEHRIGGETADRLAKARERMKTIEHVDE